MEISVKADRTKAGGDAVRLPAGIVLKPAVTLEELKSDTDFDPDGADEFVALIRAVRE
jgi:hypothetical protein